MRKLCLLIPVICLLSFDAAQAQMEQRNILVGVASTLNLGSYGSDMLSLGFTTSKYKSGNYTSDPYKSVCFNFIPRVGFFIIDNLAAGLNLWVSTTTERNTANDSKYKDNRLGIGVWGRYYHPLDRINPFLELNMGIGTYKYGTSSSETTYSTTVLGGGIGAAMPITERITFDIMAGYSSITSKPKDAGTEDYKEIMGTIGITMGLVVYFTK